MKKPIILLMLAALSGMLSGCLNQRQTADGNMKTAASPAATAAEPKKDEPTEKTDKPADSGIESVYTDLTVEKCKTLESADDEGGSYRGECDGAGGYKLEVIEGDIRQTVNVIAPGGKKSELEFWSKVSSAFSAVGDKAEWRVKKDGKDAKPLALIIRYNASEDPDKPDKNTSRLIVIKIAGDNACITDVVEPVKDANLKARELADASAGKACQ